MNPARKRSALHRAMLAVLSSVLLAPVGVLVRHQIAQADWRSGVLAVPPGTQPAIATDGDGNVALAWLKATGSPALSELLVTRLGADGSEGTTRTVATANTISGQAPLSAPAVAAGADGTATVVWQAGRTIRAAQLTPAESGYTIGVTRDITTQASDESRPDVAVDATGDALVVWEDIELVHATLLPADGGDTLHAVVGSPDLGRRALPAVAAGPAGFVAVWRATAEADADILASTVAGGGAGLQVSEATVVNRGLILDDFGPSAQTGVQGEPDVAVAKTGEVLVVWTDEPKTIDHSPRGETVMVRKLRADLSSDCAVEPASFQNSGIDEVEPSVAVGDEHVAIAFGVLVDGVDAGANAVGRLLGEPADCLFPLGAINLSSGAGRPVVAATGGATLMANADEAAALPLVQLREQTVELTGVEIGPVVYPLPTATGTPLPVTAIYNGFDRRPVSVPLVSSRPEVLSVDGPGVLGVAPGVSTVSATYRTVTGSIDIEVVDVAATPTDATLAPGAPQQYSLELVDAAGVHRPAPDGVVRWTSSNTSVATVDAAGLAVAQGPGTATITGDYLGARPHATLVVEPADGAPASPTDVQAVPTTGAITVSFSPGDRSGPGTTFTATCTSDDGGTAGSATDTAGPILVAGLTADHRYRCTVLATNEQGSSAPSLPSPPVLVPGGTAGVAQQITYDGPHAAVVGESFRLRAEASSGLAVQYSLDPAGKACLLFGDRLAFVGAGSCAVVARQPGDTVYAPAADLRIEISVTPVDAAATLDATVGLALTPMTLPVPETMAGPGQWTWFPTDSNVLPAGLTLGPSGEISGTPAAAGLFDLNVTKRLDADPDHTFSSRVIITVGRGTQSISFVTAAPARPMVGGEPTFAVTAGPGTGAITVDPRSGAVCQAEPRTAPGTTWTVRLLATGTCTLDARIAADANYEAGTTSLEFIVRPVFEITTTSLPNAVLGAAYTATLATAGGTAPVRRTLGGGTLPPGLSLSADGVLSGTPTGAGGPYTITVDAVDADPVPASTRRTYTVQVARAVPVTITRAGSGTGFVDGLGDRCRLISEPSCRRSGPRGSMVTLIAVPSTQSNASTGAKRSEFKRWGGACRAAGTARTCVVVLSKATAVTVEFARVR